MTAPAHPSPAERTGRTSERPPVADGSVELLEETIIPSPNVVELRRTPTTDYVFRFTQTTPHVAELFHENSRITPHADANTIMDPDALIGARKWFYGTAYKPREEVFDEARAREVGLLSDARDLVPVAGAGFARVLEPDVAELAFGLDLLVLARGRIHRLVLDSGLLWLERHYEERELAAIGACLPQLDDDPCATGVLVFVVGAAWRYMALQGPRGYRRTLIESGRLMQAIEDAGARDGSGVDIQIDFYDARLDRLLKLDGVERATLAVAHLTAPPPAAPAAEEDL